MLCCGAVARCASYDAHLATAPQHVPTQHDTLPQHLVWKYEFNCESCNMTLARNKAPWWWSDKIETCRSVLKCFKSVLYEIICAFVGWEIEERAYVFTVYCLLFTVYCLLFPCTAHGTMIAFYYVSSVCTYFACDKISFDIDIPLGKNWEISIFEAYLRYYTSLTVEKKFSSGVWSVNKLVSL